MPTIAGEEFDRRLCHDSQRPFHVVAAPPQAVTKTPAMATTKSRALAIHRGDGRRHLPGRYRQQHHASKRSGNPSRLHRRRPAARLSKATRTTALANCAAHCVSRTPTAASSWLRQTQARKPATRGNGRLHATAKTSNCGLEVGPAKTAGQVSSRHAQRFVQCGDPKSTEATAGEFKPIRAVRISSDLTYVFQGPE